MCPNKKAFPYRRVFLQNFSKFWKSWKFVSRYTRRSAVTICEFFRSKTIIQESSGIWRKQTGKSERIRKYCAKTKNWNFGLKTLREKMKKVKVVAKILLVKQGGTLTPQLRSVALPIYIATTRKIPWLSCFVFSPLGAARGKMAGKKSANCSDAHCASDRGMTRTICGCSSCIARSLTARGARSSCCPSAAGRSRCCCWS